MGRLHGKQVSLFFVSHFH